jgi:site-specific recombinase XerD
MRSYIASSTASMVTGCADLFTVSRMLGHPSLSTTANVYGHVTPAMLRKTAELMDAALG